MQSNMLPIDNLGEGTSREEINNIEEEDNEEE